MSAIKQSPYKNKVLPQAELVVGNTYKFGGYNWIVAEKSEVSRQTISCIKAGKSCSPPVACKLAKALGVRVEELLM